MQPQIVDFVVKALEIGEKCTFIYGQALRKDMLLDTLRSNFAFMFLHLLHTKLHLFFTTHHRQGRLCIPRAGRKASFEGTSM